MILPNETNFIAGYFLFVCITQMLFSIKYFNDEQKFKLISFRM